MGLVFGPTVISMMILVSLTAGDVCFRRYVERKGGFCKRPMRGPVSDASDCCGRTSAAGYAIEKVKRFKDRPGRRPRRSFLCTPCKDLKVSATAVVTVGATVPTLAAHWSAWKDWTACSVTCLSGYTYRKRRCLNGDTCPGTDQRVKPCSEKNVCPIDGQWGPWYNWEDCSASCEGGKQKRHRTCTNPRPMFGGKGCDGESIEERTCNTQPCPIRGGWGTWSGYSRCSKTCGRGQEVRRRRCDNPKPQFGGSKCEGSPRESHRCMQKRCPVNGAWSLWSDWSYCAVSCGTGTQERVRTCNSPRPRYGGKRCVGDRKHTKTCVHRRPCS